MKASKFSEDQKAFILKQGEEGRRLLRSVGRRVSARRRTSIERRSAPDNLPQRGIDDAF